MKKGGEDEEEKNIDSGSKYPSLGVNQENV